MFSLLRFSIMNRLASVPVRIFTLLLESVVGFRIYNPIFNDKHDEKDRAQIEKIPFRAKF